MKIKPLEDIIQIEMPEARAGVLDTSSRASATEYAKVVAVAENVKGIKPGDSIFVKNWGVDIINHEENKYYFVNINTRAILAVIKE